MSISEQADRVRGQLIAMGLALANVDKLSKLDIQALANLVFVLDQLGERCEQLGGAQKAKEWNA